MNRLALASALLALVACGTDRTRATFPQLVLSGDALDFGAVPVLNDKRLELSVTDVGRATLTVSRAFVKEAGTPFVVAEAPTEVVSGDTLPIQVDFTPPLEQSYAATLVIESNDSEAPTVEVALSGQGSTRAVMEMEPSTLGFGRVAECTAAVKSLVVKSRGTADLIVQEIGFADGSSGAFSFVGSTKTPSVVKAGGQIELLIKYTVPQGAPADAHAQVRLRGTDPDRPEVLLALSGQVNRAPVPVIKDLGNGAPGMTVALDGSGSSDPDADLPLAYQWTLRQKPLGVTTAIASPAQAVTSMQLDASVPGSYEVQLDVRDSTGVSSCKSARATVVAAPAQKLLVEMFWNNAVTDIDLHVLRVPTAQVGTAPDDCFYANPAPDWGVAGDHSDDPELLRDALTGYGPEVFAYVNPIEATYRVAAVFANDHLSPSPGTEITLRVYEFGVVKAEAKKTLLQAGEVWGAFDVSWPSGVVTPLSP